MEMKEYVFDACKMHFDFRVTFFKLSVHGYLCPGKSPYNAKSIDKDWRFI